MRNFTPNILALLASLIVSVVLSIVLLLIDYYSIDKFPAWHYLIVFSASFLITFLVIRNILRDFIYNKIKLIYKTIHELKSSREYTSQNLNLNSDVFKDVNREVLSWAADKRNEIEQLKQLEQYRREFVGNVSHELKTPVFNIQGYILTLLDGGMDDPKINKDYLKRAANSVERMISIIEDLQDISQLEAGELNLYFDKFDVVSLAKDLFEGLKMKADMAKIRLVFKENYDKPIYVMADKDRIRQVFTNLLVNSMKYGNDGGTTEIRFFDMDENILVEIADNGIGIEKQHLPRLFERFYRVDKGRSRNQGGTGLGLAIVKHIIEAHKQTINVRSTPGVGSTFSFTLKKA